MTNLLEQAINCNDGDRTSQCAEADERIAMLTAKLKLLDEPPHTP